MKDRKKVRHRILKIIETINSHHTGAYAAQAAYFFVLSLIPIFFLLLTMVQFTPLTIEDVLKAVVKKRPYFRIQCSTLSAASSFRFTLSLEPSFP